MRRRPKLDEEKSDLAQDPYQELGVSRTASADEIRKAFRKLAKTLHPDQNPNDKKAEERFKRVTGAFDILGDVEKRKKFDRGEIDADGRESMRGYSGGGNPFGGGGGGPFRGQSSAQGFEGVNFDDILGEMFSRGGGQGGPGGGFGGGRGFASKGSDIRARLEVDLEDAINGATRRITFGDGRTLDVAIPKGATDGQTLRLRGQGHAGRSGGAAGNVLIELALKRHPLYRIEGADLYMDLPVTIPDAVLGAKVDAPTPEGAVTLTVPKGSNSGATLRLKGRGGVDPNTGKRGDLFAKLIVTLPEPPDAELVKLAEEWRRDRPYTAKRKD
jgi:DnaJ-class molecular chaperone